MSNSRRLFPYSAPDEIYGELFEAVQTHRIFEDSKTFVDAIPSADPPTIVKSFRELRHREDFDLSAFVTANFEIPRREGAALVADPHRPVRQHIEQLWDVLTRAADSERPNSSLIPLPHPYVVPGGRFREIYYWDSYFTMLGLAASGRIQTIQNMVDNFAYLIDHIGFIPNGNRSYYCTRSQPPFFALMVELLAEVKQDHNILASYLHQLEKEYGFWMSGSGDLGDGQTAIRRVVAANDGCLNRYWDDTDTPRQESHIQDVELARGRDVDAAARLFRDIRSACESGWDFSSRWFADGHSLASIRTSQIVPVDLNALVYKLECTLAAAYGVAGDSERAKLFEDRAQRRRRLIQTLCFDDEEGFFVDLSLAGWTASGTLSLAGAFPLFFELATPEQASRVSQRIQREFLKPGGWVTTLNHTGQQWDAPNGWAPLQWIVYAGLRNYGFADEANEGARRWIENNEIVYRATGSLLEKYNVEEIGLFAKGGEYPVQDGFGWTNGVLLSLLRESRRKTT